MPPFSGEALASPSRSLETKQNDDRAPGYDKDAGTSKKRAASAASKAGENK
jgi:hypothetical protein